MGSLEGLPGVVDRGRSADLQGVRQEDPGRPVDLRGAVEAGRLEAHQGMVDPVVVGRMEATPGVRQEYPGASLLQDPAGGC